MSEISKVYQEIAAFGKKYSAQKIILFGSRARGTNQKKSDIDIALYGCSQFNELEYALQEELWCLLPLDIINMDGNVSDDLIKEIERDGKIIYEKI